MFCAQRSHLHDDGNLNSDGTHFYFDEQASTAKRQTISVDAKYEKKVTFARLFNRVSTKICSEVNIVSCYAFHTYVAPPNPNWNQ